MVPPSRRALVLYGGVYQYGVGCAVVTQNAAESLAEIHHRQPVLLDEHHLDLWLNGAQSFKELPALEVSVHPVAARVGNTRYDDSDLIVPVDIDEAQTGQTADLFLSDDTLLPGVSRSKVPRSD